MRVLLLHGQALRSKINGVLKTGPLELCRPIIPAPFPPVNCPDSKYPFRLATEQRESLYYRGIRGKYPPDALQMLIPGEYNCPLVSLTSILPDPAIWSHLPESDKLGYNGNSSKGPYLR